MALYDRFGRLMLGSESVPKDVLDFIVFEKHMSDSYGKWRIHSKIKPSWQKSDTQVRQTVVLEDTADEHNTAESEVEVQEVRSESSNTGDKSPPLALG